MTLRKWLFSKRSKWAIGILLTLALLYGLWNIWVIKFYLTNFDTMNDRIAWSITAHLEDLHYDSDTFTAFLLRRKWPMLETYLYCVTFDDEPNMTYIFEKVPDGYALIATQGAGQPQKSFPVPQFAPDADLITELLEPLAEE